MNSLSVVIITRNEEENLPRCLESVAFADEIIVIDSHSTDRTREIAEEHGASVFECDWKGFGAAKQNGVDKASKRWVLSIDADEEIPASLQTNILDAIAVNGNISGYEIPRRTKFLGRWIYHCGWYPDHVLRLFIRESGKFDGAVVHEKIIVDGKVSRLSEDLFHHSYNNLEQYFEKFNLYTTLGAERLLRDRKRASIIKFLTSPLVCFVRHYILRRGFMDGTEGFIISILSSCAVFVKLVKLRHLYYMKDKQEQTS